MATLNHEPQPKAPAAASRRCAGTPDGRTCDGPPQDQSAYCWHHQRRPTGPAAFCLERADKEAIVVLEYQPVEVGPPGRCRPMFAVSRHEEPAQPFGAAPLIGRLVQALHDGHAVFCRTPGLERRLRQHLQEVMIVCSDLRHIAGTELARRLRPPSEADRYSDQH